MPPSDRPQDPARRTVYQVSELAETLRGLLEDSLPRVWIQGEVSNLSRPASGHWYFTVKDARAQLRCAMFRNANVQVRPQPQDGDLVLLRAQVTVYPARGELQLVVEHLEPAGQGALLRAFEELKRRLASEGLFDEHLKRDLPAVPRRIGVITSGTGAALQDILSTLSRRFPLAEVILAAVPVQGPEAAPAMIRALSELPRARPDVILLARGGGSLEDLWAFNDEGLARAIRACPVPVVSGVGHEIDFTIADFAADHRAPTPTGAAEAVSPDIAEWAERLLARERSLANALQRALRQDNERLERQTRRLELLHPGRRLRDAAQRLDELGSRLHAAALSRLDRAGQQSRHLAARLGTATPLLAIQQRRRKLDHDRQLLRGSLALRLQQAQARLGRAESLLASLNPRAVLERGYAIALDANGRALIDAAQAQSGDALQILLGRGAVDAIVTRIKPEK
ncbi:exodeoxyribonuclease VII large subunit [Solimonas sp. K1W22B-7]|uniref:exodeoxyribonuclease VII large subunit n=1 Tax=Solimonas sp. K1W22B-7 TaxID=2303331 RepID=UPI000E32E59E|nr:exodeoxyribonuclease VII large subunit [Solimonas sp. K1W22B-7]AXQ30748.1 exodeoxyribonuclease VII large subunit [Solimonas sp. K1W22B-7]